MLTSHFKSNIVRLAVLALLVAGLFQLSLSVHTATLSTEESTPAGLSIAAGGSSNGGSSGIG